MGGRSRFRGSFQGRWASRVTASATLRQGKWKTDWVRDTEHGVLRPLNIEETHEEKQPAFLPGFNPTDFRGSRHWTDAELRERARFYEAQAQLVQLRRRVEAGELVRVADLEEQIGDVLLQARERIAAVPARLFGKVGGLTPAEVEKLLARELRDAARPLDGLA